MTTRGVLRGMRTVVSFGASADDDVAEGARCRSGACVGRLPFAARPAFMEDRAVLHGQCSGRCGDGGQEAFREARRRGQQDAGQEVPVDLALASP